VAGELDVSVADPASYSRVPGNSVERSPVAGTNAKGSRAAGRNCEFDGQVVKMARLAEIWRTSGGGDLIHDRAKPSATC